MLVPTAKTKIVDVWDTTGMRGTGSNDYIVDNVFVPFSDSPDLGVGPAHCASPLYSWPPLFLVPHAGVPIGIARSALDFVEELTTRKEMTPGRALRDDPQVQETIAIAEATIRAALFMGRWKIYGRRCAPAEAVAAATRALSADDDARSSGYEGR